MPRLYISHIMASTELSVSALDSCQHVVACRGIYARVRRCAWGKMRSQGYAQRCAHLDGVQVRQTCLYLLHLWPRVRRMKAATATACYLFATCSGTPDPVAKSR